LYSSSFFTRESLFSIKEGSSSNIALSCCFCVMEANGEKKKDALVRSPGCCTCANQNMV
jgi:hypothetical protein